jgi:hypothetical protein
MTTVKPMTRPSSLLLALFTCTALAAQVPQEMLDTYGQQWKDQAGVFIKLHTTIRIKRTDEGIVATRTVEQERLALKAPASQGDIEEVGYSKLVPLDEINAWTLVPNEKGYKKVTVTDFTHRDEVGQRIFHDDSRNVRFLFPGMAKGAITHIDYTLSYPDARMITGHYFASGDPVQESTVTVIADKDVDVVASLFHIPEGAMKHERSTERGRTVQRWTMTDLAAMQFEDEAPNIRYYLPHLQLLVRKPDEKGGTDLERMYAWNIEHTDQVMLDNDTTVQRIAREQTTGLTDPRAKAARLYAWVQDNIKYVAVEDGMNGLIPAKPAAVCQARYGDCKGMANLLRSLLVNAGLKAHLAWVGSRELPYTYAQLPSPIADDHMITALAEGDDFLLLDPTSNETPFGMPSAFIQGKQALIGIDAEHFQVVNVPVVPAAQNDGIDSVHATLEQNTLRGTGQWTFTGYQRARMSDVLKNVERTKWKDVLRGMHMKSSNRFQVDSVWVDGLMERSGPLVVHYAFTLPGFLNKIGDEMYFNRTLERPFGDRFYRKDRKLPVEEDYLWSYSEVVTIDLPTGLVVGSLPAAGTFEDPAHGFSLSCTATPATPGRPAQVQLHNTYHMNKLMMELTDLVQWRAMMDALERDRNKTIVLKPSTP